MNNVKNRQVASRRKSGDFMTVGNFYINIRQCLWVGNVGSNNWKRSRILSVKSVIDNPLPKGQSWVETWCIILQSVTDRKQNNSYIIFPESMKLQKYRVTFCESFKKCVLDTIKYFCSNIVKDGSQAIFRIYWP